MSKAWIAIPAACLLLALASARGDELVGDETQAAIPHHWPAAQPVGRGAGPVTAEMLAAANRDPRQWLQYHGDSRSLRHSPLRSLDRQSVKRLRAAWLLPTGTTGQFGVSPLVYDGVMYVTTAYNRLYALDAASGQVLWRYDHPQPSDLRLCCGPANRGAALGGELVLMATLDAQLLAFERRTGRLVWQTRIEDYQKGYSSTGAPLVVGSRVIIGVGGGEFGVRGFFDAYDLATGKRLWRHWTVPAAGEPGAETWSGDSYLRGGAPTWTTGAYDPQSDTLFWGTGNPSPDWDGSVRLGDNLYADSVIAVDPATGARKWHFQFTPHDVWDWDACSQFLLVDLELDGRKVPALVTANRNGYLYWLDRTDGRFLRALPYLDQVDWALRIEPDGRPVADPSAMPGAKPSRRVCPGSYGGLNGAWSASYDPALGLAFLPAVEACLAYESGLSTFVEGTPYLGGTPLPVDMDAGRSYAHLLAVDLATGKRRWARRMPIAGGALSTAGGVVFTGNLDGMALALDSATGETLWEFRIGSGVRGQPIAWEQDGRPYVAFPAGQLAGTSRWAGGSEMVPEGSVLAVFTLDAK
jgi:alcohol dehydrogenase (cytochrome c)